MSVKAVCGRRPTANGQGDQVHVDKKTILTVIFHRFHSAPVGWPGPDAAAPGTAGSAVPAAYKTNLYPNPLHHPRTLSC